MIEQVRASAVPCGAGRAMVTVNFRDTEITMIVPLDLWYDRKKFKEALTELFGGRAVKNVK